MIKISFVLIVILTSYSLRGQFTFNNIYGLPSNPVTFLTVNLSPLGYVVSGTYVDTVGQDFVGMALFRLDLNGNEDENSLYGNLSQNFIGIGHSISYLSEIYLHQSTAFVGDTLVSRVAWFNDLLDTIRVRNYTSPFFGEPYENNENIATNYCVLDLDSSVYLANVLVGENTYNDASLQKLDKYGNTLWIYNHATMSDPDAVGGIFPLNDGVICTVMEAGYSSTLTNHAIVRLNYNGEINWEINTSDFLPGAQRQATVVLDNDAIIVSGSFEEPGLQGVYSIPSVYKVDTLGNLIWHTTFGEYDDYAPRDFTNIVQTTDSNYVASGSWRTIPGSDEIPEGFTGVDYDEFAYVVKFDREDGSIIWDRKYRWLEVYRDNHTLRDMKATPDGGVIFCGEVQDLYMQQFEDFSQRGWVVKLDECGCLVPGCDTTCTDIAVYEQNNILPIRVYPNPASEILNIHVGQYALGNHAELLLIDAAGKFISSHNVPENNTTYMTSVADLPAGSYIMQLVSDGAVIAAGKVVVE